MEKLPRLGNHFLDHNVDAGLFSLNWFICVFVDNIPVKTYLHIWDAFLFEGSKVTREYSDTHPLNVMTNIHSAYIAVP